MHRGGCPEKKQNKKRTAPNGPKWSPTPVEIIIYLNLVHAAALLVNRAALAQNTNNVHLKTKVLGSMWHTVEQIEKRRAKINGAKIDGTKASVAWT